ncbi:MAG: hypothetical protein INH41_27445 [Myxococcaceae bacterium]|jgi:hypothetical protein|nr:hypothetical protein [Myxococcaceae bacterium]MCA3016135.1 hypothetical protein [Myxococcaceae bacterium]
MTVPFQASSTYVGGAIKALRKLALLDDAVTSRLTPAQRGIVQAPWAQGWWPGRDATGIAQVAFEVHGREKLELTGFETALSSVGPIITPLVSVIGAIFGLTPQALFERMPDLVSTSVRGVALAWTRASPASGTLVVSNAPPELPVLEPLWAGACRYILHTARVEGRVPAGRVEGEQIRFSVDWS